MNQDTVMNTSVGVQETSVVRFDEPTRFNRFIERAWSHVLGQTDRRKQYGILAVVAVCLLVQVSPYWLPTPDAASYLSIGKSLAAGEGLTRHGNPHIYYAPGYPIALAAWSLAFGHSFLSLSIAHWCLLVCFVIGVHAWMRQVAPEYAMSVAILTAVNVGVLYYFRRFLSEAVFMPLLMGTAVAMNELAARRDGKRAWLLPLICVAVVYLCMGRQAGLALPLGFGMLMTLQAFRKQVSWPRAIVEAGVVGICAVVATGCLVMYDRAMAQAAGTGEIYLRQVVDPDSMLVGQLFGGLHLRIQEVGKLLIPGAFKVYGGWLNPCMIVYTPLFAAVCVGWFLAMRTRPDSLGFAFLPYLALYLVWPYQQGSRFMTPFVPLFWLSLLVLLSRFAGKPRQAKWVVLLIPLSAISSLVYLGKDFSHGMALDRHWASLDALYTEVPADATLAGLGESREPWLMLETKLDKEIPLIEDSSRVPPDVGYLVVDTKAAAPRGFSPVDQHGQLILLRRSSAASSGGKSNRVH